MCALPSDHTTVSNQDEMPLQRLHQSPAMAL